MTKRTRYVFGAALASVALSGSIPGVVKKANAAPATAAAFTFESSSAIFSVTGTGTASTGTNAGTNSSTFFLFAGFTGASVGPIPADSGTGSAYGVHASASTAYSEPVGNGSQKSFSANHWLSGDYYEFDVPTISLTGIMISFDQTSSGTGPKAFQVQYIDPVGSGAFTSYVVGATGFSASPSTTAVSFGFDLSAITDLNNASLVKFRLIDTDTTTATAGTDRIDNFIVSGTSAAVPEPAGLALLTMAAAATLFRRRSPN
jgi:hypothetical protein